MVGFRYKLVAMFIGWFFLNIKELKSLQDSGSNGNILEKAKKKINKKNQPMARFQNYFTE